MPTKKNNINWTAYRRMSIRKQIEFSSKLIKAVWGTKQLGLSHFSHLKINKNKELI